MATRVIKKPKKNEQDVDGNRKRLEMLPEHLLQLILSFLPTKDAVRTSVLSKRWEYLWTSIPNLDFAGEPADRSFLMDFVDRALFLHHSFDIKRFSLSCDVLGDASRVRKCITTAVKQHKVPELYVHLEKTEGSVPLPYSIFKSKTLKSLHLDMLCILKLPSAISLSSLKILRIQRVSFSNEYLTGKLFSGLPVLEEMKLENCSWGLLKSVSISAPKLLSIFENDEQKRDFGNPDFCRITIVGDRLKEFVYNGNLIDEYWLHKSSSLEKACIHSGCDGEMVLRMINLLKGLSNVKQLTLEAYVLWVCHCLLS
jgi:hypothetical protein